MATQARNQSRARQAVAGLILWTLGLLAVPGESAAASTCTRPKAASGALGSAVGLHVPLHLPDGTVDGALEIWQRCRVLGYELPELRVGEMGAVNLVVRYQRDSEGNARCGMIQGRLITLYAYARDARGRALHCGPPAVNLAHELGHFFGLADAERDAGCESHLMAGVSQRYGGKRKVNEEICSAVAGLWQQARGTGE